MVVGISDILGQLDILYLFKVPEEKERMGQSTFLRNDGKASHRLKDMFVINHQWKYSEYVYILNT